MIFMTLIKQSLIKNTLNTVKEIGTLKIDNMPEEYTILGNCKQFLLSNDLLYAPYDSLFDYYFYAFMPSKTDCMKNLKVICKRDDLDDCDLLLYARRLSTTLITTSRDIILDDDKFLSASQVSEILILNNFGMFLLYLFDIKTGNKIYSCGKQKCKYKDFDDIVELLQKSYPAFNSFLDANSSLFMEPMNVPFLKRKINLHSHNLAMFARIDLKYSILATDLLAKQLLTDEYNYYMSFRDLKFNFIIKLNAELKENEYCLEINEKFFNILKKRAYLLPKSGISIIPKNNTLINRLDMYERQLNGDNYLIIVSFINDTSYFTFINLTKQFTINDNSCLYDVCNFLYTFYQLDKPAREIYGEEFSLDPHMVYSFKCDSFYADRVSVLKGRSDLYTDFEVEVPYYWRYKDKSKSSHRTNKEGFLKANKEHSFIYVSAYKRKLPKGQKASDRAKDLAEVYCIDLDENETLVSPFIREC